MNIAGDSPHRMCFDFSNILIYGSLNDTVLCSGWVGGGGRELGKQQENSYTKYAITNKLPLTATLGRVNEASHWNFFVGRLHVSLEVV